MKVCVFLTGSVRTLHQTLPYFINNVINANENIKVDVYAVIDSKIEKRDEIKTLLNDQLKLSLISLQWFDHHNQHYVTTKKWNVENILLTNWKQYLINSGSMLEYYQLLIAYQSMVHREWTQNIKYDYIFRTRTDSILNIKLDFNWLNLDLKEIESRIKHIKSQYYHQQNVNYNNKDVITLFMSTLYDKTIFDKIDNTELIVSLENKSLASRMDEYDVKLGKIIETLDPKLIKEFIINERYILTIRKNLMYV